MCGSPNVALHRRAIADRRDGTFFAAVAEATAPAPRPVQALVRQQLPPSIFETGWIRPLP